MTNASGDVLASGPSSSRLPSVRGKGKLALLRAATRPGSTTVPRAGTCEQRWDLNAHDLTSTTPDLSPTPTSLLQLHSLLAPDFGRPGQFYFSITAEQGVFASTHHPHPRPRLAVIHSVQELEKTTNLLPPIGFWRPSMFSKRLITRCCNAPVISSSKSLLRPLSTSQCLQRTPSMADIQPGTIAEFDAKQQRFRAELAEKTKKQREAERASAFKSAPAAAESSSTSSSSSPPLTSASAISSDAVHDNTQDIHQGLGSLSTVFTGDAARKADDAANPSRKPGRFSSLIYGTEEGREMDREIERSFSQVLARGKYVHSIVFHEVKPDKVDEYVELVGSWYPRVASMPENNVHLVGSWRTEVGDCDTFGRT